MAVAGSAAFESTTVKLAVLGNVLEDIGLYLRRSWRTKFQLPDNLPAFLLHRVHGLAPDRRARLENDAGLGKTGLFDSHPSAADRVRQARKLAAEGLVFRDEPARGLFDHFEGLSRMVTLAHYADHFNVPVTPDFLVPTAEVIASEAARPAAGATPPPRARRKVPLVGYEPGKF